MFITRQNFDASFFSIKANKGNQIDILHHLPVPYLFVTFTILKEFKSLADARNYDIS